MRRDFSADDFVDFACDAFPEDRLATANEVAAFLQQIKQRLDAAWLTPAQQRQHVRETLQLETVLMGKVIGDAEDAGAPQYSEVEAQETVRNWIARFWPDEREVE